MASGNLTEIGQKIAEAGLINQNYKCGVFQLQEVIDPLAHMLQNYIVPIITNKSKKSKTLALLGDIRNQFIFV